MNAVNIFFDKYFQKYPIMLISTTFATKTMQNLWASPYYLKTFAMAPRQKSHILYACRMSFSSVIRIIGQDAKLLVPLMTFVMIISVQKDEEPIENADKRAGVENFEKRLS